MKCPVDGLELFQCSGNIYCCVNGHSYMAIPQRAYQEKFCLPWGCFGSEPVMCDILGYPIGVMPEWSCTTIKTGLLIGGVAIGVYILKALFGKKKKPARRILIEE